MPEQTLSAPAVEELATRFPRRAPAARRRRLRRGPPRLERDPRPPPALIARCTDADDVVAAVNFARESDLPVAVRGGGHSAPGYADCDDGIVIDLSPMKAIDVDPAARTARAEAGLTWGEFDAATQEHGLAVTGGRFSTTGIAGLTLGSGSGWLERKCGLTARQPPLRRGRHGRRASGSPRAPTRTPSSSGACAAAAATSASSRRSSTACTRWGRSSTAACCSRCRSARATSCGYARIHADGAR